ncbi:MAG: S8 family serine peptidase, partial [Gammaproteobacteria bacterium]
MPCDDCISEAIQDGDDDPLEVICFHNASESDVTGQLRVRRFDGATKRLKLFVLGRTWVDAHNIPRGSIFGHSGLPNVLTVGAVDANDPGNDTIEFFSSRGPARIDFPGVRLEDKPDVVAVDGVRVSGAGDFPRTFYGTSASAPHVAAVAALVRQKFPAVSNQRLRDLLLNHSVDLGAPGRDLTYGSGRVDARAAYGALIGSVLVPIIS